VSGVTIQGKRIKNDEFILLHYITSFRSGNKNQNYIKMTRCLTMKINIKNT
jgi:hypothetical protein